MEATHRIRYEMVRKADELGFEGRFRWDAAACLCGREVDVEDAEVALANKLGKTKDQLTKSEKADAKRTADNSVPSVKAIRQSHARIEKDGAFGQLSAQYVAGSSPSATDMMKQRLEWETCLNAVAKKQTAWTRAKMQKQRPSVIARKRAASER